MIQMMADSDSRWVMWAACGIGVVYVVATFAVKPSFAMTAFGDVAQLALAALTTVAFVLPAKSARGRIRSFWMLMSAGVLCWFVSQAFWTYFEVVRRVDVFDSSIQDTVLFLHLVPMMGALSVIPHNHRRMRPVIPYAVAIVAVWWMFLYSFVVLPWQYVAPDPLRYATAFNVLYTIEDLVFMAVLGLFAWRASGAWRTLYRRLLLGSLGYVISEYVVNLAIAEHRYYTGSYFDLPLLFSITCICWSATSARTPHFIAEQDEEDTNIRLSAEWLPRLSFLGLLSVPFFTVYAFEVGSDLASIRNFRIGVSMVAIVLMGALLFKVQHLLSAQLEQALVRARKSNEELSRAREALQHQATHDSMTGVMNRLAITEALERELSRAMRSGTRTAALLVDLDHFKEINDRFGHHAGDVAIVGATLRFKDCIRAHDYLGRYGGEEFLVIVPEAEYPAAIEIAERIRTQLSATPVMWQLNEITLTATIGVALSRPTDTVQTLLRRADLALYSGKTTSRDTVQVADEDIFAA